VCLDLSGPFIDADDFCLCDLSGLCGCFYHYGGFLTVGATR
jgi:hypothetical protein